MYKRQKLWLTICLAGFLFCGRASSRKRTENVFITSWGRCLNMCGAKMVQLPLPLRPASQINNLSADRHSQTPHASLTRARLCRKGSPKCRRPAWPEVRSFRDQFGRTASGSFIKSSWSQTGLSSVIAGCDKQSADSRLRRQDDQCDHRPQTASIP